MRSLALILVLSASTQAQVATVEQIAARVAARGDGTVYLAGDTGATVNSSPVERWQALQRAHDAAKSFGRAGVEVVAPYGTWSVPWGILWDGDTVRLRGQGSRRSTIAFNQQGYGGHGFVVGVPRVPYAGTGLTTDVFPSLDDILDGTVAGKRGVWLTDGRQLSLTSSPIDRPHPDWWAKRRHLTVEMAWIDWGKPKAGAFYPRMGMSVSDKACPWYVMEADGNILCRIATDERPVRQFRIAFPGGRGVHRVVLQVDCEAGKVMGIVGGRVAKVVEMYQMDGFGGEWFRPNEVSPLLVGAMGSKGNASPPQTEAFTLEQPRTLWLGWRVADRLRYAWGAEGGTATRLDGQPITDLNTFYTADAGTLGHLDAAGDPAKWAGLRLVPVAHAGGGRTAALCLEHGHANPGSNTGFTGFSDVAILGNGGSGQGIACGHPLFMDNSGLRIENFGQAFGTLRFGANYTVRLLGKNDLGAFEHCIALYMSTFHAEHVDFWNLGDKDTIYAAGASRLSGYDWFMGPVGRPRRLLFADDGTLATIRRLDVDIEDGSYPGGALFAARVGPHYDLAGQLVLDDVGIGSVPPRVPIVDLLESGDGKSAQFSMTMTARFGATHNSPLVRTWGPRWKGVVSTPQGGFIQHEGQGASGVVMVPGPAKSAERDRSKD